MKSLILLDEETLVLPNKSTDNLLQQASQAYGIIFLTELGSIEQLPNRGSSFKIGSINTNRFVFLANRINNQVLSQIRDPYSVSSSSILSITPKDSSNLEITIEIIVEKTSTTFSIEI